MTKARSLRKEGRTAALEQEDEPRSRMDRDLGSKVDLGRNFDVMSKSTCSIRF